MENPFAESLRDLRNPNTRKLLFAEQCAYYAGLKLGVPQLAVSKASGLGHVAISHLARAGEKQSNQRRYPAVAREYEALGHEAFIHRYLTAPIREKLKVAIDAVKRAERERAFGEQLNAKGYSLRANRMVGRYEWPQTTSGVHVVFRVEEHPNLFGYLWRNLKPFYDQPEIPADEVNFHPACYLRGDPQRGPERGPEAKGFPRSDDCFGYVRALYDPKIF